jgi:hypothetical protein
MGGTPQPPPTQLPSEATIKVTTYGLADQEIDPAAYGKTLGEGLSKSSWIPQFAMTLWRAWWELTDWLISWFFSGYDRIIAFVADQLKAAVGRNRPGFWILVGSLISDVLGVNVDGAKIYQDLQTRGTLPAMRDVGAGLMDLLIGEFTGTARGEGGEVKFNKDPNPATGLPEATLTPKGGVDATKALMGFVLASAVRQANIDGLCEMVPRGYGHVFEKYTEGIRTNLGIGRLLRFALRPIFQDLVAKPLTWAINLQYRPSLLDPADLLLQFLTSNMKPDQLDYEFGRHGYSTEQQKALITRHTEKLTIDQARLLYIHGDLERDGYDEIARRRGWRPADFAMWEAYEDLHPARRLAVAVVEEAALQYLRGHIPQTQLKAAIEASSTDVFGRRLLSEGEEKSLKNFSVTAQKLVRRHLSVAELMIGYIDGVLTLGEVETSLSNLGFDDNDVKALTLEMLVKQKQAVDKAARTHAHAAPPKTPTTPPTPTGP